ncbi:MAG: protein kinase, partial [Bradyrhizobium icense]
CRRISEALGDNGQVITDVLPLLQQLIGPQPLAPGLFSQEARNRFDVVFPRFVAALVSKEHPLVLFLDELQWADAPSLQLIRTLLTEPRLNHLLVVGAYREDEVGSTHPLPRMKEELEQHGTRVTSLTLAPLEPGHVVQLVSDMFHWDAGRAAPLARLLWERARGNPFFIGQLLRALYEDGLIDFSPEAVEWTWDMEALHAEGLADDVLPLLARGLRKLPEDTRHALELAACIGNRFQLASLATVREQTPAATAAALYPAMEQGLLLPLDTDWWLAERGAKADVAYRFVHTRVQQATYSSIPEGTRAQLHLRIGRLLLTHTPAEQVEEQALELAHQFNLGGA